MPFSNFSKINTLRLVLVSSRNFCLRYAYKLFDFFNICDEKFYDMPMLYKLSILLPETLSIFKWKNESLKMNHTVKLSTGNDVPI